MTEHIESTDVEGADEVDEDLGQVPTSRRRLFQLGLAGAAVAAGAAAIDGLASSPAAAATGGPLLIGVSNAPTAQANVTLLTGHLRASPTGGGGAGVEGTSGNGIGVLGIGSAGTQTVTSIGVQGQGNTGVLGQINSTGTAVRVAGVQGAGVGTAPGLLGGNTTGASLALTPFGTSTLPAAATTGSFIVLADGSLHYAYATNTWTQLNNGIVTLPAPVRIIDSTNSTGGITGPLAPSALQRTTSVLTGLNGIPTGAKGLIGNLAISGVGGALLNGFGVATIFPAGVATPATANINAGAGCFAISNTVTVALGTGGSAGKLAIVWNGGGAVPNAQVFFDVSGYIL